MIKAIIFTIIEFVLYFCIASTHALVFSSSTVTNALNSGLVELVSRIIIFQAPIQLLLLTLIFYSPFKNKVLIAVIFTVIALFISLIITHDGFSGISVAFRFSPDKGYINILIKLIISASLTALILKNYFVEKI